MHKNCVSFNQQLVKATKTKRRIHYEKYLALILALCMLLALAACGEPSEPADSSEPPIESGEPVSEEPVEAELDIMMSFPQFMDQWETYCKQFEEKCLRRRTSSSP